MLGFTEGPNALCTALLVGSKSSAQKPDPSAYPTHAQLLQNQTGAFQHAWMEREVTPGSWELATEVALPPAPGYCSMLDLFKVFCKHGLINPLNHPRTQYYY